MWFNPILMRNDDHHKVDPVTLFIGPDKRPIIDEDWSVNVTQNPLIDGKEAGAKYTYDLNNVDFEDAGIYICDEAGVAQHDRRKNITVIGDKVICKDTIIKTKEGETLVSECELPVDGPDEVDLGWFMGVKKLQSTLKPIKPEDHSITTVLDLVAQPHHHAQKIECRYASEGQVQFSCPVPVEVTYKVQVKGTVKSVYHDDTVEGEILVIGNPWPGKASISVASDDIFEDQTEMDELENKLGVDVTVHIPLSAFDKKEEVHVAVKYDGQTLSTVAVKRPKPKAGVSLTYVVVIVVLAVAALLLIILIIVFLARRSKSQNENIAERGEKDVRLADRSEET